MPRQELRLVRIRSNPTTGRAAARRTSRFTSSRCRRGPRGTTRNEGGGGHPDSLWYDPRMDSLTRFVRWRLGLVDVQPWARPGETECLVRHAAGKRRLAEIGVWEGGTTRQLRAAMNETAVLYAIDPFPPGRLGFSYQLPIAHGEAGRVSNGEVVWIRATGADAARDPRVAAAPFDFVFIDGDHRFEGLQADWQAWSPLASDVLALHDVIDAPELGSVRFAREHIFTDPKFRLVESVGCLAVLKRVPSPTTSL